jgi:hypothetical protein
MKNKNRKSVIRTETIYVVDMYEDDVILESRPIIGHSLRYAEDCAENWETGIITRPIRQVDMRHEDWEEG